MTLPLSPASRAQDLRTLLATLRLPFVVLAPMCVLASLALVWQSGVTVDPLDGLLAVCGAVCAHVAVNALNEYHDFHSGLDAMTRRTPFSGGSGALPSWPQAAPLTLAAGLGALTLTLAVGAFFLWRRGAPVVGIGVAGLLLVLAYTRWITRSAWLCLIAPGLGFGPLMMAGTWLAVGAPPDVLPWLASWPVLCAVSNLLLLNQLPDAGPDAQVGRRHWVVRHGIASAVRVYVVLAWCAPLGTLLGVAVGLLPVGALAVLLTLPWVWMQTGALRAWSGVVMPDGGLSDASAADLLPLLGRNVQLALATPVALAVGLGLQGAWARWAVG